MVDVQVVEVEWRATQALRMDVLGWDSSPVAGDRDELTTHLALLIGAPVAVVSYCLHRYPPRPLNSAVYFWGMAVAPARQRSGLGSRLMRELIGRAVQDRRDLVWGDARDTAVPFYEKCGATVIGDRYLDDMTGRVDRRVVFDLSHTRRQ